MTLPAGTGPKGLPLGIQLVGPRFRDEALLDAAAWVEPRLVNSNRRPGEGRERSSSEHGRLTGGSRLSPWTTG